MYDDVLVTRSINHHSVGQSVGGSVGRSAGQRPYTGRFSTKCTVCVVMYVHIRMLYLMKNVEGMFSCMRKHSQMHICMHTHTHTQTQPHTNPNPHPHTTPTHPHTHTHTLHTNTHSTHFHILVDLLSLLFHELYNT